MKRKFYYAHGARTANFSTLDLPVDNILNITLKETAGIVKEMRKFADLPYIFVVAENQADTVSAVLTMLKNIRSRCYPYAVFILGSATLDLSNDDLDIFNVDPADEEALAAKITEYIAQRFQFDSRRLKLENAQEPPKSVDVAIVGAGVTGLYAAERLKQEGLSFCVLDQREEVGGIWSLYANTTSRVNSSEGAYRLIEKSPRVNRDHSATREVLEDIAQLSRSLADDIFLSTEVKQIDKTDDGYEVQYLRNSRAKTIQAKGVILAVNDRVGPPRKIRWSGEENFKGTVTDGTSDNANDVDWSGKKVVVVGMGAFAIENARTALEGGASHVTVLCRRHGTICPKIIDYLNFATPYDEEFKHDKKSNIRNMMYWKKLYDLSGATQPECWMGKIKHPGHTISVSDIWFIAHYLKKVETVTGSVAGMDEKGVITDNGQHIEADIVVNCVGFERNASAAKAITGYDETYNINYLDKDLMYLADAYIDDDAFNSFFGSSVLEMVKFYLEVYIRYFNSSRYEEILSLGGIEKLDIEQRKWTDYIKGAAVLIQADEALKQAAQKQVDSRTKNFLEQHDLETYIAENKREWMDLHTLLAGKEMTEEECLPYVFEKLLPK